MKDMMEIPWIGIVLQNVANFERMAEYHQLMKTPAQSRIERGIDPHLTSQKPDKDAIARKKKKLNSAGCFESLSEQWQ